MRNNSSRSSRVDYHYGPVKYTNPEEYQNVVSFAAVFRVVTQRSSSLTTAHSSSAFLSLNWPIRSRLPFSGNMVFGDKCNEKYDWRDANNYMHVIGSQYQRERNAELERAAVSGEDRCVTTLITAAKETNENVASRFLRLGLPSTLIRHENVAFRKRSV